MVTQVEKPPLGVVRAAALPAAVAVDVDAGGGGDVARAGALPVRGVEQAVHVDVETEARVLERALGGVGQLERAAAAVGGLGGRRRCGGRGRERAVSAVEVGGGGGRWRWSEM